MSSWRNLTDTCTLTLPRSLQLRGNDVLQYIKTGDKVTVRLAYSTDGVAENAQWQREFTGYLAKPSPSDGDSPALVLECEDEMWRLKQVTFSKSYRNIGLKALIDDMIARVPGGVQLGRIVDIPLGKQVVDRASPAQVLKSLQDDFRIYSYFREGKLYAGYAYEPEDSTAQTVKYHFQKNVVSPGNLKFRRKDDIKIKVQAVSHFLNGTKLTAEVGDADGEQRSLTYFELSMPELKRQAEKELDLLRIDGYEGSFTAFGRPYIRHGWRAQLQDDNYPERKGTYLVDGVDTDFGVNGFRRMVQLGKRTVA
jgi:hypothetical protein